MAARDPHFFPEQRVEPWRPSALLLWEADEPDYTEDVSGFVDAKFAALMEHRSQLRSTMTIDDPGDAGQVERFRAWVAGHSAAGEAFKRIDRL